MPKTDRKTALDSCFIVIHYSKVNISISLQYLPFRLREYQINMYKNFKSIPKI